MVNYMIRKHRLIKLISCTSIITTSIAIIPVSLAANNTKNNLINNYRVLKNASNFYELELTLGLNDLSLLDAKTIDLSFTNINTKMTKTKSFPFLKVNDSTIRLIIDNLDKLNDIVITKIVLKTHPLNFANHLQTSQINLNEAYVSEQTKIALYQRISLIVGSIVLGVVVVIILIISKYYKKKRIKQKQLQSSKQITT